MISFDFVEIEFPLQLNLREIRKWLSNVIVEEGKIEGELNYQFCSDKYLHKINLEFLNHDTLTDIITFSSTDVENIISGEIYLSIDRVIENSNEINTKITEELKRVIVHGVLHLIGFKDKSKEEALLMRKKENYYLGKFINI